MLPPPLTWPPLGSLRIPFGSVGALFASSLVPKKMGNRGLVAMLSFCPPSVCVVPCYICGVPSVCVVPVCVCGMPSVCGPPSVCVAPVCVLGVPSVCVVSVCVVGVPSVCVVLVCVFGVPSVSVVLVCVFDIPFRAGHYFGTAFHFGLDIVLEHHSI